MPLHIPPPDQTSLRGTGNPIPAPDTGKHATDIPKNETATSIAQEVDRIQSKYWHNRLITFCKNKIKRLIHPQASIKVSVLVDDLTKHCPNDPQKVLAALKLHTGRDIKLHQSKDGKLAFTDGKIAISTKTIEAVVKSIKQSSVEIAYEYLRKGQKIPEGYLQQIMLPYIHKTINQAIKHENKLKLPATQQQLQGRQEYRNNAEQYVKDLLNRAEIKNEKDFSFEKMLEFKKQLRNNLAPSIEEQMSVIRQKKQGSNSLNAANQRTTTPQLPEPGKTNHFIEKEDSQHIQKLTSEGQFFSKTHIKDMGNQIKRAFLRNKRNHMFLIAGIVVTIVIAALFPPAGVPIGIAIAIGTGIEIFYDIFWISVSRLWTRFRLIRGLRQIKRYANFDHTAYGPETDKRRKKLIQRLLYRCKHKTFSQIYDAYAELEKQGIHLKKIEEKGQKTLAESIRLEKEKALYHERRKKLESNLYFFDKLIEQVTISRAIIESRNQKNLESLWNEKFAENKCNPLTRNVIFKKASEKLIIQGHEINIKKQYWLRNFIKYLPDAPAYTKNLQKREDDLNNSRYSKQFKIAGTLKSLAQSTFFRSVKKTVFFNLINLGKLLKRRASITIHDPFTVTPNLIGTSAFIGFFFLEMATSHINNKQNQSRSDDIKNKKKSYTKQLFGKRLRTGREEVGTLRSLAKDQVEPLIDHLLESIKSMEKTSSILEDAMEQSKIRGKGQFGTMSDEEAATLILKHEAWQKLLDKEINNAFTFFHEVVQEKVSDWDKKLTKTRIADGKQAISASTISDAQTRRHISPDSRAQEAPHQQLTSENFLRNIRNRASGKLIRSLRKGEISEAKAFQKIRALNNLDELLALQFWIDTALKEGSYHQNADTLKKLYQFTNYIITNQYNTPTRPQHQTGNQRPIDPI